MLTALFHPGGLLDTGHFSADNTVSLEDAKVHASKTFRSLAQMFLEMYVSQ